MRYGVFVNKFLVADFPDGNRGEAVSEAFISHGEFYDFWTGEHFFPRESKISDALTKEGAMDYLQQRGVRGA